MDKRNINALVQSIDRSLHLICKNLFKYPLPAVSRFASRGEQWLQVCYIYSYFEKGCRKNVHATIPKGNMGYDQYNVSDDYTCPPTFVAFLKHFQTHFHSLLYQFFQFSLKNRELKTTHNAFRELSRAVFPTTCLEIAVYKAHKKD